MKKYLVALLLALFTMNLRAQTQDTTSKKKRSGDEIYTTLKNPPTFPGGSAAFYKFLYTNIVYPADSRAKEIQGKVILVFIIEKDGALSNFRVISSPAEDLGKESVRVMYSSPKWNPGKLDGEPVRFLFKLPVNFSITKPKAK